MERIKYYKIRGEDIQTDSQTRSLKANYKKRKILQLHDHKADSKKPAFNTFDLFPVKSTDELPLFPSL